MAAFWPGRFGRINQNPYAGQILAPSVKEIIMDDPKAQGVIIQESTTHHLKVMGL